MSLPSAKYKWLNRILKTEITGEYRGKKYSRFFFAFLFLFHWSLECEICFGCLFVWGNRHSIRTFVGVFCWNILFFVWNWIHLVRQLYIPCIFWFHNIFNAVLSNADLRAHSAKAKHWLRRVETFVVKKSQTCTHKMREKSEKKR